MALLTSENSAQAILKAIASIALETLVAKLVLGRLVNRNYEATLQNFGDVVNVPIAPTALTPNSIGMSGTVVPQTPSMGNAQIVLTSHYENSFQLPSSVSAITTPNLVVSYMDAAIKGLATQIESSILATYPLFTNTVLGGSTTLGEATVDSAESALASQYVPATQRKNLIVSVSAYSALRQISAFRDFETVGFMAGGPGVMPSVMSGRLPGADADPNGADGYLKGFYVYRSQLVPYVSSLYQNFALADDAVGLIVRALPIAKPGIGVIQTYMEYADFGLRITNSYQQGTLSEMYTVDALWGVNALRPQFGVVVQSL